MSTGSVDNTAANRSLEGMGIDTDTAAASIEEDHNDGTNHHSQQSEQQQTRRKDAATARWRLLRDALLQKNTPTSSICSIHRFLGYQLLPTISSSSSSSSSMDASTIDIAMTRLQPHLTTFVWNDDDDINNNNNTNKSASASPQQSPLFLDRLELAVWALAACYPKGKCLTVVVRTTRHNNTEEKDVTNTDWIAQLSERCQPTIKVVHVDTTTSTQQQTTNSGDSVSSTVTTTTTKLLVQESSSAKTKYSLQSYQLDNDNNDDNNDNNAIVLLTREPNHSTTSRVSVSLQDLVSHRHTPGGVDNTGNICVWDSEKTLTYLLWNHGCWGELSSKVMMMVRECVVPTSVSSSSSYDDKDEQSFRILELGTGMAGLSAVALGMRLQQQANNNNTPQQQQQQQQRRMKITLTDGNVAGVHNNKVNQYLMEQYYKGSCPRAEVGGSPYAALDVSCQTLLWTTDMANPTSSSSSNIPHPFNVVLVSDCVHFQNFHAALLMTTLRNLRVHDGTAIFCQPTRGDSLSNFCQLLEAAVSYTDDNNDDSPLPQPPLLQWQWWEPAILKEKRAEAMATHSPEIYDESLHHPKILLLTKLRDVTKGDQQVLIETHQQIQEEKKKRHQRLLQEES